uniref:Proline dehydrogenase n=1 Tax=Megaselia scalaris TaxID=36166 RepID=T1GRH8_MEGSC
MSFRKLWGTISNKISTKKSSPRIDLTFNDPEASFRSKTTPEVLRAYIVYKLCSYEKLVDHNMKLMKISEKILGKFLFSKLMKATFFGHFVGGEDLKQLMPFVMRLQSFGVKSILDYSVEEDLSEEQAEKIVKESSVSEMGDEIADGSLKQYHVMENSHMDRLGTGITAIKLTALGRPQLLLQISEVIMKAREYIDSMAGGNHKNVLLHHKTIEEMERYYKDKVGEQQDVKEFLKQVTSDKEGIINLFPWSGIVDENFQLSETFRIPDPKTGRMRKFISQITPKEESMFRNMIHRVNTIAQKAKEVGGCVMVDAEQTYFQPAISRITVEMMRKHNKEKVVVMNTYQNYLQSAFDEVKADLEQAKRQNFYFGAKIVRGAYMEQERARAKELGYPDPINPTYEATSEMYHKTLIECLTRIRDLKKQKMDPKRITIMVASHNEDTIRLAINKMDEIGVSPEDNVILFGQLLGMCDFITFPLGAADMMSTSIYHMVLLQKCFLICREEPLRIRV